MDKITAVKNQYRELEWKERIEACKNSGMTVLAWCDANEINPKSYYYWLRKLREQLCTNAIVPIGNTTKGSKAAVTLHAGTLTVEIADGTSAETIKALISALGGL